MTYKNIAVTESINEMIDKLVKEKRITNPEESTTKSSLVSKMVLKEYKKVFNRK